MDFVVGFYGTVFELTDLYVIDGSHVREHMQNLRVELPPNCVPIYLQTKRECTSLNTQIDGTPLLESGMHF